MTTQNKFAGASLGSLLALIDQRATKILDKCNLIECVARGGESRANSLNLDGDPIDLISGGIFSSIINTTTDMNAHIDLRDAVNELRRIASQQPALVRPV